MQTYMSKIKEFYNSTKKQLNIFLSWKSDNAYIWLFKTFIMVLVFTLIILFFKYVFPTLLAVILIVFLIKSDEQSCSINLNTYPLNYVARDILFSILRAKAEVIEAEIPKTVDDITPTKYPVENHINNIIFYSFIIRFLPDHDNNFIQKKNDLNIFIEQKLSAGFKNLSQPFYNGIPVFKVISVNDDNYHFGYYRIDVMPIIDTASYDYVIQQEYNEQLSTQKTIQAPDDKDF